MNNNIKYNNIKKIIPKKNIKITSNKSIIKIKSNEEENLSMEDSFKLNKVLLWGLNKVDSIILEINEKQNLKKSIISTKSIKSNKILTKTNDTEYDPSHIYNTCDIDFLNKEYQKIEIKISKMTDYGDEFDKIIDIQDKLSDLINNLEFKLNDNLDDSYNSGIEDLDNLDNLDKLEFKNTDNKKNNNRGRKIKLKPYYNIGEIPDGFREATQEEAILNKKVSFFGKKKVSRELYNIFNVTGTLFLTNLNLKEINIKIISLKGKLKYYKKQYEYYKISLESDDISQENFEKYTRKLDDINTYYKKTHDVLNLYLQHYANNNILHPFI